MPRPKLKSDDEVLEAATAVLKRCGPIDFTLSGVAKEAGLSRATLIQRFTNRDTLLVRMMERGVAQVRRYLDAMPLGAGPQGHRGLDVRVSLDLAIAAHEKALQLDPGFLWPYNEVCASYGQRATSDIWQGVDPAASVARAVERCDQAIGIDASFTLPATTKAFAYAQSARYLAEKGRSPDAPVASALAAAAAVKDQNALDAANVSAWSLLYQAMYECDANRDPSGTLARAEAFLDEKERLAPSTPNDELRGLLLLTTARYLMRQGKDPTPVLTRARALFRKSAAASPWDMDYRLDQTAVELLAIRWAQSQKGRAGVPNFISAFAPLSPLVEKERSNPAIYQALAELHEMGASFLLERRQPADQDLQQGLRFVDKALALNPHFARALATKSALHLLQARAAKDPATRHAEALRAKISLEAAIDENPLLSAEQSAALAEAKQLLTAP